MVDVTWTGLLANYLVDLNAYISLPQKNLFFKKILTNNTDSNGRLVSVPLFSSVGMLYFRRDLLDKYDRSVPRTWEELAETAKYIVDHERKINPDLLSMQKMITGFGIQVQAVSDAESIIGALVDAHTQKRPFDILLIDAQMNPAVNLKKHLQTHHLMTDGGPKLFLLITHFYKKHPIVREHGVVDGYFIKPLRRNELIEAILLTTGNSLQPEIRHESPASIISQSFKHMRILLVEDNINNQMLFKYYLKNFGQRINVAQNGSEGVNKFKTTQYDIVFMDLSMPVMDGYKATRAIRRLEGEQGAIGVPIIALTADALKGREQKSLAAGCTDHITKPFTINQLMEVFQHYGQQSQGNRM